MASIRVRVKGIVQGVGFRPFVYQLAKKHGLKGWVLNDQMGVDIHLEGEHAEIESFLEHLPVKAPPAARIDSIRFEDTEMEHLDSFQILDSRESSQLCTRISPDLSICADCLRDLNDPHDAHFEYPYVNCTNCGPRFSIINSLPYDRIATTMAGWSMCSECRVSYDDPSDRRFHAQPIACPECGPTYSLIPACKNEDLAGELRTEFEPDHLEGAAAIRKAARLIREGKILAIKGIGGYHLALDASNCAALKALRERKYRKDKPFAVMVETTEIAKSIAELCDDDIALIESAARPIVLAAARKEPGEGPSSSSSPLSSGALSLISPDNEDLGLMLPYSPLHHLLFKYGAPPLIVMTSANRSSEPIAFSDESAIKELNGIADFFLVGERPIQRRMDDSVVARSSSGAHIIRRSRGFAPDSVAELPSERPILALGADLKNTIALVVSGQVFVSQYIGDLEHAGCYRAFKETIKDFCDMYRIKASELTVVRDSHPQYYSGAYASELDFSSLISVQHHRAHIASVLAEKRLFDRQVLGIAFDGTGWGDDGSIWGGEFLLGSLSTGFSRVAALDPAVLPGGDAAAKFPPQALAGFLFSEGDSELCESPERHYSVEQFLTQPFAFSDRFKNAASMVRRGVHCFKTTSVGRLFDAVAALVGFSREISFEAQAAIWLEHLARKSASKKCYEFEYDKSRSVLKWRSVINAVVKDREQGVEEQEIARRFMNGLAAIMAEIVLVLSEHYGVDAVALSGGVMQNMLLIDLFHDHMHKSDIEILLNEKVPANDGGISLGQAAIVCFS